MDLNTFFTIINKAGRIPGTRSIKTIAGDLFEAAGITATSSAIDSWLKKGAKSKRNGDFTGQIIDDSGFIEYFAKNTSGTWQDMQKAFCELDNYNLINRDTKDSEIFYKSLLSLFYELLRLVPVSLCYSLPEKPQLIGREMEIGQISEVFETSNYIVLTGIGGIGKSNVALAYAHLLNKNDDWIIQHVICENSDTLRSVINKLRFENLVEKRGNIDNNFDLRLKALKNQHKPVLILLDNLDRPFADTDYEDIKKLSSCGHNIRFIITSRNALLSDKKNIIHITPLDHDSLTKLYVFHRFEEAFNHDDYIADHKDILEKIFALINEHTLMTILLAKLPERSHLDEYKIYNLLYHYLNLPSDPIRISKDELVFENSINEIIKQIFDISQFTDKEKSIMMYMSLVPFDGINSNLFTKLTGYSRNEMNNLRKSHWLMLDSKSLNIKLHPLIYNAITSFNETTPSSKICTEFCQIVKVQRDKLNEEDSEWHSFNKIIACVATRFMFPKIVHTPNNLFDHLKDEYQNPIREINNILLEYLNMDI